jgi:hypothetical protein
VITKVRYGWTEPLALAESTIRLHLLCLSLPYPCRCLGNGISWLNDDGSHVNRGRETEGILQWELSILSPFMSSLPQDLVLLVDAN